MFPILNPLPTSLPILSLWVIPVHQPQASGIREPLMWRPGSQVSLRMARGSTSWLSSHGRGESPVQVRCMIQDAWGWCTGTTQRDGLG